MFNFSGRIIWLIHALKSFAGCVNWWPSAKGLKWLKFAMQEMAIISTKIQDVFAIHFTRVFHWFDAEAHSLLDHFVCTDNIDCFVLM